MPASPHTVLQVLDHSLPEQSGYAYRSHAILRELATLGVPLDVLTSPKHGPSAEAASDIDGIRYRRTPLPSDAGTDGVVGQLRTIRATRREVAAACRDRSIGVIHAHSPCLNGLAALGHGVPLVYEMRSSWEDASASVGVTTEGSLRYRLSRALETFVVRRADAVVVICEGLRQELLGRGVPDERITIAPNALPADVFREPPQSEVAAVRERYALSGHRVIGFFGSFFEWEGIDDLVGVMPDVAAAVPDAHLLLAGGGRQEQTLRDLVADMGLETRVTFAGRVQHDEVMALYQVADVVVFPRVPGRLTDMVTPIKPLEAMAQGTIVVASDVGGHRELVRHGETGFLYPAGSREGLARAVCDVLQRTDSLAEVRDRARSFVSGERRWSVVAQRYLPLYENLGQRDG